MGWAGLGNQVRRSKSDDQVKNAKPYEQEKQDWVSRQAGHGRQDGTVCTAF